MWPIFIEEQEVIRVFRESNEKYKREIFDVRPEQKNPNSQRGQWRNDAPGAPAKPGGAVLRGRQIVIKCGTILQD